MLNLILTQIYINYCSNRVGTYVGTYLISKEGQTYGHKKGCNGTGETNDTSKDNARENCNKVSWQGNRAWLLAFPALADRFMHAALLKHPLPYRLGGGRTFAHMK